MKGHALGVLPLALLWTLAAVPILDAQREPVRKPNRVQMIEAQERAAEDTQPRVVAAPVIHPPGKYRISVSGFTVNHQTDDDPLQLDGKGDEVYLSVQVLTTALSLPASRLVETPIIGDKNGFPNRIAAGSASDLGGLRTGDRVHLPTPLVLWEGPIPGGLLVTPTVWEWDGNSVEQRRLEKAWRERMGVPYGKVLGQFSEYGGPSSFGGYPTVRVAGYQELTKHPCNYCFLTAHTDAPVCGLFCPDPLAVNRPIGVNMSSGYRPGAVRLGYGNLEGILAGTNMVEFPVQYQDNQKGSGDYTIHLRLERIP